MAQFVRCMEGHAFDVARSATCPTCGSPVSKREPAAQKRKPAAADALPRSQPDAPRKEPAATKPSLQARMSRKDAIAGIASMAVFLVMLVAAVSLIRRFLPDRPIPALIQAIGSGFHSKPPEATVDTKSPSEKSG